MIDEDERAKLLDTGFGSIQTYTRKIVKPTALTEQDIDILDIAHALSNICRFTGHCSFFYSVAQHSTLGAIALYKHTGDASIALEFLLHDASEAYICDIPRPLKQLDEFKPYIELERKIQQVICNAFGVNTHSSLIKHMDKAMLATEKRDLMKNSPDRVWSYLPKPLNFSITPMLPESCETLFLEYFNRYDSQRFEEKDMRRADIRHMSNPGDSWRDNVSAFQQGSLEGR